MSFDRSPFVLRSPNDNRLGLDSRGQTLLLALGYGLSAMVFVSSITRTVGLIAAGFGAVIGVLLFRWHVEKRLRNVVPALIGFGLMGLGLTVPPWLGHQWWLPYLIGISSTLVIVQALTLALMATGFVLVVRSLSRSARALSMLDGLVIILAICWRFSGHRNFNWSNPRFFSDWAGIQGYELPLLFALAGLVALLIGLVAGMRTTTGRHAAASITSVLLLLGILLWIGGNFLRNPTPELITSSGSSGEPSDGESSDGEPSDGDVSENGSSSNESDALGDGAAEKNVGETSNSNVSSNNNTSSSTEDSAIPDPLPTAASQRNTPEPIALVLLEEDVEPYENVWYFRQTAVSLFNGKRLVTASDDRYDTDIPSGFSDEEVFIGGIPLPMDMHKIIPLTVNLIAEQPRPFSLPSMISFVSLPNPDTNFFRRSYRASSCVLTNPIEDGETFDLYATLIYHYAPGNPEWDNAVREHYIQSPKDERFKELADQIISNRMTPKLSDELQDSTMLKALSIKRWLEENTTYSLDPKFDNPTVNPAEQFLFGERTGYCVHIAHASVYLLRALGIPSRIGIGYMVPTERNGKSSSILIQSTDAHAWAEIYLQDAGWIIVDAMPEKIDEATQLAPEPDPTVSQYLADKARNKDDHQSHVRKATSYSRGFPLRMKHLPWLLLLSVVGLYCVKAWILLSPWFAESGDVIRVTQRATILHLAECGIQRHFGETRTEFSARVAATYPEFVNLTECHVRQTYGFGSPLARDACLEMQLLTSKRIRLATSLFRRTIGRLDPRFWILVR